MSAPHGLADGAGQNVFQTVWAAVTRKAHCAVAKKDQPTVDYAYAAQPVHRADTEKLRQIFTKYASVEKNGKMYMDSNDFVRKYLGMYSDENYNRNTVDVIASAADTTKTGLISFAEFAAFEAIFCTPDALYLTVFELFDRVSSEMVHFRSSPPLKRITILCTPDALYQTEFAAFEAILCTPDALYQTVFEMFDRVQGQLRNGAFQEFAAFEAILCTPDALYQTVFEMFDMVQGQLRNGAFQEFAAFEAILCTPDALYQTVFEMFDRVQGQLRNGAFQEFAAFEAILCTPDALYQTVFEMFDKDSSEMVSYAEFVRMIKKTQSVIDMPFEFDSTFIKLYFGADKSRLINYQEFCQLLHDFHREQGRHAFRAYDKNHDGYIKAVDFNKIMSHVKPHMLSAFVRDNLIAVAGGKNKHRVSFPWFLAFNEMIAQIELLKRIYLQATRGNLNYEMSKDEYLQVSQSYAQVTPLAVAILFDLADLRHPGRGTLVFEDLERIDPERLKRVSYIGRLTNLKVVEKPHERTALVALLESVYRFALGSIAGACGATAVYPIDLVKTRMQNQRTGSFVGEVMYKNSWDCFKKVLRHEGALGLYRGLLPQIVGVAPEKAIKLTTNDFMRDKLSYQGKLPLWAEIVAGGCGGASQVAGEIQSGPRVSVFTILKDLGFFGLYKGARACFLRDIPFSAIYFPTYAHAKLATADENGLNGPGSLFVSAFIAGVPAAGLVTPADVIKTRLQVAARAGQTTYTGLLDCYKKIAKEEGHKAFWKGSIARVCRSSPQFAVTMVTYELLQRMFYVDFGGNRPQGSEVPVHKSLRDERSLNPDHVGGYQLATPTFASIESKFGLYLPRFQPAT